MSVKPHIEGDTVTKIEVAGKIIRARNRGFPLTDLPEVVGALNIIQMYLDLESIGEAEEEVNEWTREEIFEFLDERNSRQILFFRILSERPEIDRENLVREIGRRLNRASYTGRNLAGTLAGIGIRTNALGKEPLYEKKSREEEDEWKYHYWLTPSYEPIINEWLAEEEQEE